MKNVSPQLIPDTHNFASEWAAIAFRYHAAFLLRLLSIGISFDDVGVFFGGVMWPL